MNNKVVGILAFVVGAAVGAFAAQQYFKKKYERIAQEEIDSVKEAFTKKDETTIKPINIDSVKEKAEKAKEKPNVMEYAKMLKETKYVDYSTPPKEVEKNVVAEPETDEDDDDVFEKNEDFPEFDNVEEDEDDQVEADAPEHDKPFVISPDDFGMMAGYETSSLLYFKDKVLTDYDCRPVDDADEMIGLESLTHFGEYEADSVFVRNDSLKCDFEILLDERKYSDIG